ncbi:hypothetical protein BC834DRAFT_821146, partial [Gloeopeniophorella convolvens]
YGYNTHAAYGANIAGWGANDPLNATRWYLVTEPSWRVTCGVRLVANANLLRGRSTTSGANNPCVPACAGECATAKICHMRSGLSSIALRNCRRGFGFVQ